MRVITKSAVLAAIFLGTFVVSARAEEIIRVDIPFAFVVDHHEFPAGHYDVRRSDDGADCAWTYQRPAENAQDPAVESLCPRL